MEEELVKLLIENNLKVSTAESCTGGLIAAKIVSVASASKVFDVSFVTYANEAKVKYLGVDEQTIKKFGVVSEEVTKEMALGLVKETKANLALVTSGIAGPTGGSDKKPVGMVCFGICLNEETYTSTVYFGNIGRNNVREKASNYIIEEAIKLLKAYSATGVKK